MHAKLENLAHSRVRLTITVPAEVLSVHYQKAIEKVGQQVEIKGFRKGHAPANLVIERAGQGAVLQEMLDLVVPETYYQAIKEQANLLPVEPPKIEVKELKELDSLTYVAEVDIMPEIKVGDYQKIKIKPVKVSDKIDDKELDDAVTELKKVYEEFKDDAETRQAVTESLKQQKVLQAESQTYDLIIEALLKRAKVEVPEAFIHNEIHRMERQVELQAKAYGLTFEDWLTREKKTHEDIHQQWREPAEKAAKVGLVLGKIAELEGIDSSKPDASRLVLEKLRENVSI